MFICDDVFKHAPAQGTGRQLSRESAPPASLGWLDAVSCGSEPSLGPPNGVAIFSQPPLVPE